MKKVLAILLLLIIPVVIAREVEIPETFVVSEKIGISLETSYFYAGDKLISSKDSSGITYHYKNRLGSDINSKSLPFGQSLKVDSRFSFTGKELDKNLYYFGARYYDSNFGRFTSVDPIKDNHAYSYVDNNPMNYVDPDGREIKFLTSSGESYEKYQYAKGLLRTAAREEGGNYQRILDSLQHLELRKDIIVDVIDTERSSFREDFKSLIKFQKPDSFTLPGIEDPSTILSEEVYGYLKYMHSPFARGSRNSILYLESKNPIIIMNQNENKKYSDLLGVSGAGSLIHELGHVLFEKGYFEDFEDKDSDLWANPEGIYTLGPREGFSFSTGTTGEIIPIYMENMIWNLEGLDYDQLRASHYDRGY